MKQKVWWVLRRAYGATYYMTRHKTTPLLNDAFLFTSLDAAAREIQIVAKERAIDNKDVVSWYPRPIVPITDPIFKEISIETVLDWEPSE